MNLGLVNPAYTVGLADAAPGGRPVAPVLLIKSGNQPLSHCRERESLVTYSLPNWSLSVECVAGLHVPLITSFIPVNRAPWFENLAT